MSNIILKPTDGSSITNVDELNNVLAEADFASEPGVYEIDLAGNIAVTSELGAIELSPGVTLDIVGGGFALDGANSSGVSYGQRGLFVYSGTVVINNLTIENTIARGGAGAGGGGGGAGLGGGLFLASGANATLDNVAFDGDSAVGGAGSASTSSSYGGGGGGLGGAGGVVDALGAGGGGGVGGSGGAGGGSGGPGIIPDFASGGGAGGQGPVGGFGGGVGSHSGGSVNGGSGGFGGGGGGGAGFQSLGFANGGGGGFGGGGGGSPRGAGGVGGVGGGGGDGGLSIGSAGFGGGNGSLFGGGGGLGAGGDVFVQSGASLTLAGGSLSGGGATGGAGADALNGGEGLAAGIYLQGSVNVDLAPTAGVTQTISDAIGGQGSTDGLTLNGAGTVALDTVNTYSGGTTIKSGTLEIGANDSAGTGAITFAGSTGILTLEAPTANGTPLPNVLANFSQADQIDLPWLGFAPGDVASVIGSTLTVTDGPMSQSFTLTDTAANVFLTSKDASGGTLVTVAPFTAFNESQLEADIRAVNLESQSSSGGGARYQIDLAPGATLLESSSLTAINLKGTDSLIINGQNGALDGNFVARGLFVYSGSVTVENLTIENCLAQGGAGSVQTMGGGALGGAGGGGAGLGGGLFIADDAAHGASPSHVLLNNVVFKSDSAVGGQGGYNSVPDILGGGGGGLGGAGSLGGGGVGVGASGGASRGSGGAGLVQGGASGGLGNLSGEAGGASGGGGGGNSYLGAGGGGGGVGGGGGGGVNGKTGGAGGFGGGGGGGPAGGAGGFGGGGGGGYENSGGAGGYGGGGGGGFDGIVRQNGAGAGSGGFGGGDGAGFGYAAGGGGLGAGGDIFVQAGASLTIDAGSLAGGSVNGGSAAAHAQGGEALGSGIFLQGSENLGFAPAAGATETIADVIADETGSGGGGVKATGVGRLTLNGAGTLDLAAANTFTGGVTIKMGTLTIGNVLGAGTGAITFAGASASLVLATGVDPANAIGGLAAGDSIDFGGVAFATGDRASFALNKTKTGGIETISNASGLTIATFDTVGATTPGPFLLSADSAGNLLVSVQTPVENFDGGALSDVLVSSPAGAVDVGQIGSNGQDSFTQVSSLRPQWRVVGAGDFFGVGVADFLVENGYGKLKIGEVQGETTSYVQVGKLSPGWSFREVDDFLGLGHDQFLIQNMNGVIDLGSFVDGAPVYSQVSKLGLRWTFEGAGDFLDDGDTGFVVTNPTRALKVGEIRGDVTTYTKVGGYSPAWTIEGTGDFLGEGHTQLLLENASGDVDIGDIVDDKLHYTEIGTLGPQWKFVAAGNETSAGVAGFLLENSSGELKYGTIVGGHLQYAHVGSLSSEWTFHS